jgi:hypothetical protein
MKQRTKICFGDTYLLLQTSVVYPDLFGSALLLVGWIQIQEGKKALTKIAKK